MKICTCFFSPCHNTGKIAFFLADKLSKGLNIPMETYDFTLKENRIELNFTSDDIVIIAVPTYAGRVPNRIMPYIKDCIKSSGSIGIAVTSFGNRSFDYSLTELKLLMKNNGFRVISGLAVPSAHSFASIGENRPDEEDMTFVSECADKIVSEILSGATGEPEFPGEKDTLTYYKPLKKDGSPASFLKAVPVIDKTKCTGCMACTKVCPEGTINTDTCENTGVCIKCQACIKVCPQGARYFNNEDFLSHKEYLEENHSDRKLPFFLI